MLIEMLLQLLIGKVNAELLKIIFFELLKTCGKEYQDNN